jgi:hypothetical protein
MSGSDLNSTTDDLLIKYDDYFNENYNKIVSVNSSIMNKEELIVKENDVIMTKDNKIILLQYLILLVITFGIAFILYGVEYITLSRLIIISIILIVIFLIIIYYKVYLRNILKLSKNTLGNIGVELKDYALSELARVNIKPYTCPITCKNLNNNNINVNEIQPKSTPTLNIDPQNNVWKYGDIPAGGYSDTPINDFYDSRQSIQDYSNENNEPKSFFGKTYPYTTYYKCDWLGPSGNNQGMPINDTSDNTYSTIPCSYRPNYQESGRYICQEDPNKENINTMINGVPNCTDVFSNIVS